MTSLPVRPDCADRASWDRPPGRSRPGSLRRAWRRIRKALDRFWADWFSPRVLAVTAAASAFCCAGSSVRAWAGEPVAQRPNILLITVDDMNCDSVGVYGCRVKDVTPNIDRLAGEGVRFTHAFVTAAICQPSRQALMTGRYPHCNGAPGFDPIAKDCPTLQEHLRAAGYRNGIFSKVEHLAPKGKFCWDTVCQMKEMGNGRDPDLYYRKAKLFFEEARKDGKPFFLMANSNDPHRPFAGAAGDGLSPPGSIKRRFTPEEIVVPGFLPDLPGVRKEIAQYFTSAHRADQTVGAVLRALKESGAEDNTLVMFLSDNGISEPFAKTNCWLASNRTPWIARWPGKIKAGTVDDKHVISGVDYMPTILEAAGLPADKGVNGRSFLPVLLGREQEGRDVAFTVINTTSAGKSFPMRAAMGRRFGYIFNAWADGQTVFDNEAAKGQAMAAMTKAAKQDAEVAARVKFFRRRVPEELYDYQGDPHALRNLIADPRYAAELSSLREALRKMMAETKDPVLPKLEAQLGGPGK